MNSKSETDEASRGSEATSSNNSAPSIPKDQTPSSSCATSSANSTQDIMKRAAARELIEKYFYQLIDGCGNSTCDNEYCASSGESRNLTPNEAAAEAIKLFYNEAKICNIQPTKIARTESNTNGAPCNGNAAQKLSDSEKKIELMLPSTSKQRSKVELKQGTSHYVSQRNEQKYRNHDNGALLTEEKMYELCQECIKKERPGPLIRALGEVFLKPAILAKCFPSKTSEDLSRKDKWRNKSKSELKARSSRDPDKDVDSVSGPGLDIPSCQRAFTYLAKVPPDYYSSALVTSITAMSESLELDLRTTATMSVDDVINCFVIAFEVPDLGCSDYLEIALPALCIAVDNLTDKGQAKLARIWAQHCKQTLRRILDNLQQLITLRVMSSSYSASFQIYDDEPITMATKLMKVVYYASVLAGVMEPNTLREDPVVIFNFDPLDDALDQLYLPLKDIKEWQPDDPLATELNVNVLDSRKPLIPFEDFYNEPLSDTIEVDIDLANCKSVITNSGKFSFLKYPFILTPSTKSMGLYYENRIRMFSERRVSLLHSVVGTSPTVPFLRLRVRRGHLIDDALVELEMIAMERPIDFKKQLVVEFEGEQGVDEGGVSKEFFQLIVEEIFNPDYGMFIQQPDSHTVWFNSTSFETEGQFTLIGLVLGLAIYNNIILPVNFPMVVYRKLMGKKGSFEDLSDWNTTLYNGLKNLLEYTGDDVEEVYYQTFRIGVQDVFGNNSFHDLKRDGDNVFVTQANKKDFIGLYSDFLLNKSVERQFKAFRRGFFMVADEGLLAMLFRPEEVETLVCGSKNFDFNALEKSTDYDGGYNRDSQIIKDFWSIVHNLSLEDKRKLLQFTTGSDRVPVGGLSHLKMVVARNGADSDRLPTAHTCFNVLLLPEYVNKEKLEDRLLKAISYSKGFGML